MFIKYAACLQVVPSLYAVNINTVLTTIDHTKMHTQIHGKLDSLTLDNEGIMILWNARNHSPNDSTSNPKRTKTPVFIMHVGRWVASANWRCTQKGMEVFT
jgi:hypothetical protein